MKAFLTVIGKDKVGIVAAISDELFKLNVNIVDITQTIMDALILTLFPYFVKHLLCIFYL